MPIKTRPIRVKTVLALLTIIAIAGTLSACGRYGRPVRPKASFLTPTSAIAAAMQNGKAQNARIGKPNPNPLRTPSGAAPSVLRSSARGLHGLHGHSPVR